MELVNLEEAINKSKVILENKYSSYFSEYSMGFIMSNENVEAYLRKARTKKNRALTVLGSGDHVFDLICHDFKNIDALDINKLQYYVYYLKKTAIENLSFNEFFGLIQNVRGAYSDEFLQMLNKLKNKLPEDVYEYYRRIIEISKTTLPFNNLFFGGFMARVDGQAYLKNEKAYLALREKMAEASVNLYFGDARDVVKELQNTYDLMLLSNIADFFGEVGRILTKEEYSSFLKNCLNLLNDKGLFISLVFHLASHLKYPDEAIFNYSSVKIKDFRKRDLKIIHDGYGHGYIRIRKKHSVNYFQKN